MMNDLISRLSELRSQFSCFSENERDAYHTLSEAIEALQEQRMGQWICEPHPNWGKWGIHITRCSECGFSGGAGKWNFCPNCGAKMEV